MKALVLEEYNKFVYKDVPEPEIKADEVLVRVRACGICGSDIHGMDGTTGRRIPPVIMGHEASGVIAETGTDVRGWKAGDRVTFDSTVYQLDDWYSRNGHYNLSDNREVLGVSPGTYRRNGAFAEYVAIPQHILYRIPENVTFEQAAMVEAVAVALHSVNISSMKPGSSCLVTGAGMIGVFLIKLLKVVGPSVIIAADINKERLETAKAAGADSVLIAADGSFSEKIGSFTSGRGADIVFDVAGTNDSFNTSVNSVRKGGTLVLVGNFTPVVEFPLQKVVTGELKILGSCAICGEYETVLEYMKTGKITVHDQIGQVAPLSEGAYWFDRLHNKKDIQGKVILVP